MKTDKSLLSVSEFEAFSRDGFLVIRGLYDAGEVRRISEWVEELAARPSARGGQMAYYEDSRLEPGRKILSRIEKFVDFHEGLRGIVYADKMMGRVRGFLGGDAALFKEKINFKLSGGGGFEPHQDIQPGWDDYAGYFISVLVTIDKSTVENGCLELAAGHHKRGLIGRKWQPLEGAELAGIEFVQYPMEPGDVAFFDCYVPHQSKPNLTAAPRRNLYLTYNRSGEGDHRERYFADKRKSYPPDFERDPGKEYKFKV